MCSGTKISQDIELENTSISPKPSSHPTKISQQRKEDDIEAHSEKMKQTSAPTVEEQDKCNSSSQGENREPITGEIQSFSIVHTLPETSHSNVPDDEARLTLTIKLSREQGDSQPSLNEQSKDYCDEETTV